MSLSSICKTNPESADCSHWQREVCGQCPNWNLDQDEGHISSDAGHKLMTTDECQRLKRELQASLFKVNRDVNPMTILLLMFFVIFCLALTVWLLARAFVLGKRPEFPNEQVKVCDDRQPGGHASVESIMRQLRDKCATSGNTPSGVASKAEELFVPPHFWKRFPVKGFRGKTKKMEAIKTSGRNMIFETEDSDETSNMESSESLIPDELTSEETEASTSDQSEQSSMDEDQTSITINIQQAARDCTDILGKMPTCYGPLATTNSHPSNSPKRGKMRWANWLRRSKQTDSEV
ncbi:GH15587 [Drosophila grimshawi]|uniref:GH15587 n=1 Tax=Drosophila grimshawi TaxID=7222 RepID=B4JUK8_DROGR|nr:GH15587 [Drosophila grimshawi]